MTESSSGGGLGPVSRKPRKLFGPEKPFVKLWPAYSVNLVFLYVVKGIKIKITAKFRASRRLSFEDTKRILSPEMRPKSFGTFEKQAPAPVSQRSGFESLPSLTFLGLSFITAEVAVKVIDIGKIDNIFWQYCRTWTNSNFREKYAETKNSDTHY